jgi:hypothetical protein
MYCTHDVGEEKEHECYPKQDSGNKEALHDLDYVQLLVLIRMYT